MPRKHPGPWGVGLLAASISILAFIGYIRTLGDLVVGAMKLPVALVAMILWYIGVTAGVALSIIGATKPVRRRFRIMAYKKKQKERFEQLFLHSSDGDKLLIANLLGGPTEMEMPRRYGRRFRWFNVMELDDFVKTLGVRETNTGAYCIVDLYKHVQPTAKKLVKMWDRERSRD